MAVTQHVEPRLLQDHLATEYSRRVFYYAVTLLLPCRPGRPVLVLTGAPARLQQSFPFQPTHRPRMAATAPVQRSAEESHDGLEVYEAQLLSSAAVPCAGQYFPFGSNVLPADTYSVQYTFDTGGPCRSLLNKCGGMSTEIATSISSSHSRRQSQRAATAHQNIGSDTNHRKPLSAACTVNTFRLHAACTGSESQRQATQQQDAKPSSSCLGTAQPAAETASTSGFTKRCAS